MRVRASRRCAASPETVWPWIADPNRHVRTLPPSVTDVRVLDNGDIECVARAMGLRERMRVRVTETNPPHRLVEKRVDGHRHATTVFEIEPAGDGSLVTVTSEIALPRLLGRLAGGPIRSGLEEELANLDRLSAGA